MRKLIALMAFAIVTVGSPVMVHAEDGKKAVAVLDVEAVIVNSKQGKSATAQLQKLEKDLQALIKDNRTKLADLEKSLLKDGKEKMSKAEFEKARNDFTTAAKKYQDKINEARKNLEDKKVALLGAIHKNVSQIAADVADEHKFQVVIDRKSVVLVQEELDITRDVLTRLDKQFP